MMGTEKMRGTVVVASLPLILAACSSTEEPSVVTVTETVESTQEAAAPAAPAPTVEQTTAPTVEPTTGEYTSWGDWPEDPGAGMESVAEQMEARLEAGWSPNPQGAFPTDEILTEHFIIQVDDCYKDHNTGTMGGDVLAELTVTSILPYPVAEAGGWVEVRMPDGETQDPLYWTAIDVPANGMASVVAKAAGERHSFDSGFICEPTTTLVTP